MIERETTLNLADDTSLDEFWLAFERLSHERPARVPPSVVADVASVRTLRDELNMALTLHDKADERLLAEAKRGRVSEVVSWFERDYLGFSRVKTRLVVGWCILGGLTVLFIGGISCAVGQDNGRAELREKLLREHCVEAGESQATAVCEELRSMTTNGKPAQSER